MPDAEEFEEPELNKEMVAMLVDMGIPETAAKHACFNTHCQGAEIAMNWFYENIDNPVCQTPLRVKKQKGTAPQSGFQYNEEGIMMIMSMGLTDKQAKRGLRKCNNDVERAMDWIFSHMDEPDSEDNEMVVD